MQGQFIMRGLPRALARDGWWLTPDAPIPPRDGANRPGTLRAPQRLPLILIALIAAGDLLFWQHAPGLSLALFSGLILAAALALGAERRSPKGPALLLAASALPVIEHVQALSLAFLIAGTLLSLAWLRLPPGAQSPAIAAAALGLARTVLQAPARLFRPVKALRALPGLAGPDRAPALRALARNWAFPLGGALVLGGLLIRANPVLSRALSELLRLDLSLLDAIARAALWLGLGLLCTALLSAESKPAQLPRLPQMRWTLGLNAGSVLRGLWVFNGLLGVQTVMDLSIFLGGAALPQGMSHAEYAHRGAYPLLATAMLAGGFALAARPFLGESRLLKPLLLLWLGQNVLLCLSSVLRLDLYVDAFGLTYLRIHAMIWMALVATSLALTLWQVMRGHSNIWLTLRAALLGLATLYACCFVNFAAIIAAQQLDQETRTSQLDRAYLCALGPMAYGAVRGTSLSQCIAPPRVSDWRDWTLRAARVGR
ncbi:DUF4153 domain-containing protein [Tropicibacter oceani]|uniref:DUF4173 domain-containing protein n=1 Tax=Tropicibacter oceani TaxID=3058420 RepID=A0ABY8QLP7_9RHOB|nr:DUF4173 domain-containing protein [Tropicibacter oceani]WGW05561.1 DUF4173 domain-containing protein [Tropicibacter oceani]